MTRIDWLLKGDPLFSLQTPRRMESSMIIDTDDDKFIPTVLQSKIELPYIGPPSEYRYLGQRAVMP